jgi:TonB family protein
MRKQKNKSHIIASVLTLLFAALLFLFLWFFVINVQKELETLEEGVEVAFAEEDAEPMPLPYQAEEGAAGSTAAEGEPQPSETPAAPPTKTAETPRPVVPQEATKPPMTQQTESPVKQEPTQEEDQAAKAAAEARAKAEAAAKAKAEAEAKARAEAEAKAQKMGNLFGKGNGGAGGSGGAGSSGNTGTGNNPAKGKGSGKSGNGSWSLSGRDIIGTLPQPEKGRYQPGKVVVTITVNPQGKVTNASIGKGTTVSDNATLEAMKKKAMEARFIESDQKNDQQGQITYIIPE